MGSGPIREVLMHPLTWLETVFLLCAVLGGLLFLLRLGLSFFSAEAADFDSAHIDQGYLDVRHVGEGRFPFLTQQGITGFLALFGLAGLALSRADVPPIGSALGGIAAGLVGMLVIAWIFLSMQRVRSDGVLRIENTISKEGSVTLAIPAESSGQVSLILRGAPRLFDAVSAHRQPIPFPPEKSNPPRATRRNAAPPRATWSTATCRRTTAAGSDSHGGPPRVPNHSPPRGGPPPGPRPAACGPRPCAASSTTRTGSAGG